VLWRKDGSGSVAELRIHHPAAARLANDHALDDAIGEHCRANFANFAYVVLLSVENDLSVHRFVSRLASRGSLVRVCPNDTDIGTIGKGSSEKNLFRVFAGK